MSSWFESVALFPNRSSDFWEESYSTKSSVDSMSGKKKKGNGAPSRAGRRRDESVPGVRTRVSKREEKHVGLTRCRKRKRRHARPAGQTNRHRPFVAHRYGRKAKNGDEYEDNTVGLVLQEEEKQLRVSCKENGDGGHQDIRTTRRREPAMQGM